MSTYPTTATRSAGLRLPTIAAALTALVLLAAALALVLPALQGSQPAPAPSTSTTVEQQVPLQWLIDANGPYGYVDDRRPIPRNIR